MRFIMLLAAILVGAPQTYAKDGFDISAGLFRFDERNVDQKQTGESKPDTQDSQNQFIHLGACYRLSWFCIGAKYLNGSVNYEHVDAGTEVKTTYNRDWTGMGLSLGLSHDGWLALYSYLFSGEHGSKTSISAGTSSQSSDTILTFPMKSAYTIDLAYGFKVKKVRIGPMFTLFRMEHAKVKAADGSETVFNSNVANQFIIPSFVMWIDLF